MMENREVLNRAAAEAPAMPAARRIIGRPFARGRSGNPAGRPPKAETALSVLKVRRGSVHEMVRAGALTPVQVEIDGCVAEISALEAAAREVAMLAANGDRMALVTLARLMAATEHNAPEREEAGFATPEVEAAEAYKYAWSAVLRTAADRDVGLPVPMPHPDEIVIDRASAMVGYTKGPPAEPLSLEPMIAAYRAMRAALRTRLDELKLPHDHRPQATRDWHAVADTIDEIDRQLRRRYRQRPMLPEIDTEAIDLAEVLAAHADRARLFAEGFVGVEEPGGAGE